MALTRWLLLLIFVLPVAAQNTPTTQTTPDPAQQTQAKPTQTQEDEAGADYVFKVNVVERSAKAVNYRHRGGATKINFAGTELMPKARGEAKVESKQGYIEVEVEFDNLSKPATIAEPNGATPGSATASCTFTAAGVYKVTLTINDSCGGGSTADEQADVGRAGIHRPRERDRYEPGGVRRAGRRGLPLDDARPGRDGAPVALWLASLHLGFPVRDPDGREA